MIKIKRKFAIVSLLFFGILSGCQNQSPAPSKKILIDTVSVKNSVKKENYLDSLDRANAVTVATDEEYLNKMLIQATDSTLWLNAQMRLNHRIFGYEKADLKSKRLIFFSIFTNDVENNPFQCKYGSYYSTTLLDERKLKYVSAENDFIKTILLDQKNTIDTIYFERKWITFPKQN